MKKGYVYTEEQRAMRRAQMLESWAKLDPEQRRARLAHFLPKKKYANAAEKARARRARQKAELAKLRETVKRLEQIQWTVAH